MVTRRELTELGVGFVSLTEALDLTTPTGRVITPPTMLQNHP
jgi:DNA invertase Pin-like site-specific DNA recombinase